MKITQLKNYKSDNIIFQTKSQISLGKFSQFFVNGQTVALSRTRIFVHLEAERDEWHVDVRDLAQAVIQDLP
jgi:hypothetical protein